MEEQPLLLKALKRKPEKMRNPHYCEKFDWILMGLTRQVVPFDGMYLIK